MVWGLRKQTPEEWVMKEELRGAAQVEMLEEEIVNGEQRKGRCFQKHVGEMQGLAKEDSFIIQDLLNETAINTAPQMV